MFENSTVTTKEKKTSIIIIIIIIEIAFSFRKSMQSLISPDFLWTITTWDAYRL